MFIYVRRNNYTWLDTVLKIPVAILSLHGFKLKVTLVTIQVRTEKYVIQNVMQPNGKNSTEREPNRQV
jgi:hypothetical protein